MNQMHNKTAMTEEQLQTMHNVKKALCATLDDMMKDAMDNDWVLDSDQIKDIHYIYETWCNAHKLYHAHLSQAA